MAKSKLKVGIIGCGGIANGKHLPNMAPKKDILDIVAFCDIVPERAEQALEKYGAKGAKVYTDYQKMLTEAKLDVVHVCTPNISHAEISVAALEAGNHVMCEKPMAKTASGARRMLEASQRTKKLLTIGYNNRFRADSQYLKTMCAHGDLGDIYYARALALRRRAVPTWGVFLDAEAQGGGPLIDIGTHALDLTLWMMDNYDPEYVVGATFRKLGDREGRANAWGPWDPKQFTVEDSAFGFVKFKNGAVLSMESSWAINIQDAQEAACVLVGSEAGADMKGGLRVNGERYGKLYEESINLQGKGVAFFDAKRENPSELEFKVWYDAILTGSELTVKPEQALVVSEILEAIYLSNETGKPVFFDEMRELAAAK